MMSVESIRKKGYLYKLPVKGFVKKWTRRWFVLHGTTRQGVVRIEYYDNENCEITTEGKRTIPLRDCSALSEMVGNKIHPYVFQFKTPLGQHVFASDSQVDLDEWTDAIQEAVHEDRVIRKSKKQKAAKKKTGSSSTPAQKSYTVSLERNATATQMSLQGTYDLEIGPSTLSLVDAKSGVQMATWQYKHLKNFGKQSGQFYFEIGALPGVHNNPGHYICLTAEYKEIFSTVNTNIKVLREATKNQDKNGTTTKTIQAPLPDTKEEIAQQSNIVPANQCDDKQKERQPQNVPLPVPDSSKKSTVATTPLKYSVMTAGGKTTGRTAVAKSDVPSDPFGDSLVHAPEHGVVLDDDGFSYGSFDSFDSFDDIPQQPVVAIYNPITTGNEEKTENTDYHQTDVQTTSVMVGHVAQLDTDHPSTSFSHTAQGSSPAKDDKSVSLAYPFVDQLDTSTNKASEEVQHLIGHKSASDTAAEDELTLQLDKLQSELGIGGLVSLPMETPYVTATSAEPFQNPETTVDDIANFDLDSLLQNTAIQLPTPLGGDVNPEDLVNLDLMNADFLLPTNPMTEDGLAGVVPKSLTH